MLRPSIGLRAGGTDIFVLYLYLMHHTHVHLMLRVQATSAGGHEMRDGGMVKLGSQRDFCELSTPLLPYAASIALC